MAHDPNMPETGSHEQRAAFRDAAAPGRPTPVRALPEVSTAPASRGGAAQPRTVEVDGVTWTVSVQGRALSGVGGPGAPLMLLRFSAEATGASVGPTLETLVVGRELEGLGHEGLLAAFAKASPPPDGPGGRGFFAEADERRRR